MFELDGVEHWYGTTRVLAVDSWHVGAGETCLLAGPSGSG